MLSELEETFADAWGLALAAVTVTDLVAERTLDPWLLVVLNRLDADAHDLQGRCLELAGAYPVEIADELRAKAQSRRSRAAELTVPWFKTGTSAVEAWAFLAMTEAGEVATWTAARRLARNRRHAPLTRLATSAVKAHRRHLAAALEGVEEIAASARTGLSATVAAGPARALR